MFRLVYLEVKGIRNGKERKIVLKITDKPSPSKIFPDRGMRKLSPYNPFTPSAPVYSPKGERLF